MSMNGRFLPYDLLIQITLYHSLLKTRFVWFL